MILSIFYFLRIFYGLLQSISLHHQYLCGEEHDNSNSALSGVLRRRLLGVCIIDLPDVVKAGCSA